MSPWPTPHQWQMILQESPAKFSDLIKSNAGAWVVAVINRENPGNKIRGDWGLVKIAVRSQDTVVTNAPTSLPPLAPLKAQRRIMPVLKQEVFAKSFCFLSLCYSCKETHIYVLQLLQILLQISWLSSHTKRPQEFGNFVSLSTVWQYITAPFFMKTYVRKMENTWGNCSLNL